MSNIILLNGCSSSGKSTIALKLQQLLSEPYQYLSLDQFRDGLPLSHRGLNSPAHTPGAAGLNVVPRLDNGEPVTDIQFGAHGERVLKAMRRTVASFSDLGLHVIVDDLLFKREYLEDYVSVLNPTDVWFIGVHCELAVIKAREAQRQGRFPGTATAHYKQVHQHGCTYDLEVDTTVATPSEVAQIIITRLQSPPQAFSRKKVDLARP